MTAIALEGQYIGQASSGAGHGLRRTVKLVAGALALALVLAVAPSILPESVQERAQQVPVVSEFVPEEAHAALPAVAWTIIAWALRYGVPAAVAWGSRITTNIHVWNGVADQLKRRGYSCPRYIAGPLSVLRCRR